MNTPSATYMTAIKFYHPDYKNQVAPESINKEVAKIKAKYKKVRLGGFRNLKQAAKTIKEHIAPEDWKYCTVSEQAYTNSNL